nr:isochorismatase family protein [uncultured Aquabacterium sp.]
MLLDRRRSALVLVDHQARLMPAIHDAERVLDQAVFLARLAREMGVPVMGTEQNPQALGGNEPRLRALCDRTLSKAHFSAVADGLLPVLREIAPEVQQLVLAGCETHVCLLQTALEAQQSGLQVFVVPEACGSRRPEDKARALQRLQAAGVSLVCPEMVAFEWLRSCEHPAFRAVLSLVKAGP